MEYSAEEIGLIFTLLPKIHVDRNHKIIPAYHSPVGIMINARYPFAGINNMEYCLGQVSCIGGRADLVVYYIDLFLFHWSTEASSSRSSFHTPSTPMMYGPPTVSLLASIACLSPWAWNCHIQSAAMRYHPPCREHSRYRQKHSL